MAAPSLTFFAEHCRFVTLRHGLTIAKAGMALAVMTTWFVAVGCAESDAVTQLSSQVAALRTQIAQPTPTVQPVDKLIAAYTPTPSPDIVVGVELRCAAVNTNTGQTLDLQVPECIQERTAGGNTLINRRLLVTVRTYAGTTYVVAVAPDAKVTLGQAWPPAQ